MSQNLPPRVLIIAGSDSGGGAGIQADIKTVTALGGYAMTAITAVTVQDSKGVHGFHAVPPDILAAQIRVTLSDIGADAIKTGMLVSAAHVNAVADALQRLFPTPSVEDKIPLLVDTAINTIASILDPFSCPNVAGMIPGVGGQGIPPLIIDTVMIAKGGTALLDPAGVEAMKARLFPLAALITPNAPEAAALAGIPVVTPDDALNAADILRGQGVRAVLVKGGHLSGDPTDVLVDETGVYRFTGPRLSNPATHGTGCTLASAIATNLAYGVTLREAVQRGRAFVQEAIRNGLPLGSGTGPVNPAFASAPKR